jgi:hypothetical protein
VADHQRPTVTAHARGVLRRLDGDRAWEIIDRLAQQNVGGDYPGDERVVFVVAVDHAVVLDYG